MVIDAAAIAHRKVHAQPPPKPIHIRRTTRGGRKLEYELAILQQPERARACGSGNKASADRRPMDPPPVGILRIYDVTRGERRDITFHYDANFFLFAHLENARTFAPCKSSATAQPSPPPVVLTGIPVSGMAYLDRPYEAGYFLFPDLSVGHEGRYQLVFNLYEETKNPEDYDMDREPILSPRGTVFEWRSEIRSIPFSVYSAKKFPGLSESTALSRTVAEQGCRVRIRRDVRMRRRDMMKGEMDDDYDDDMNDAAEAHWSPSHEHTILTPLKECPFSRPDSFATSEAGKTSKSKKPAEGKLQPPLRAYSTKRPPPCGNRILAKIGISSFGKYPNGMGAVGRAGTEDEDEDETLEVDDGDDTDGEEDLEAEAPPLAPSALKFRKTTLPAIYDSFGRKSTASNDDEDDGDTLEVDDGLDEDEEVYEGEELEVDDGLEEDDDREVPKSILPICNADDDDEVYEGDELEVDDEVGGDEGELEVDDEDGAKEAKFGRLPIPSLSSILEKRERPDSLVGEDDADGRYKKRTSSMSTESRMSYSSHSISSSMAINNLITPSSPFPMSFSKLSDSPTLSHKQVGLPPLLAAAAARAAAAAAATAAEASSTLDSTTETHDLPPPAPPSMEASISTQDHARSTPSGSPTSDHTSVVEPVASETSAEDLDEDENEERLPIPLGYAEKALKDMSLPPISSLGQTLVRTQSAELPQIHVTQTMAQAPAQSSRAKRKREEVCGEDLAHVPLMNGQRMGEQRQQFPERFFFLTQQHDGRNLAFERSDGRRVEMRPNMFVL